MNVLITANIALIINVAAKIAYHYLLNIISGVVMNTAHIVKI